MTLSTVAIVEKNKLARTSVFIVLLKITLPDNTILRLSSDNTNTWWAGATWVAFPFEIDEIPEDSKAEVPQFEIRIGNASKAIQAYMETEDGVVDSDVVIYVVNSDNLADSTPEFTANMQVIGASADPLWAHFTLGASNPYNQRFPKNRILKNYCRYPTGGYGGARCQYLYTPWTNPYKYVDSPDIEVDPNSRITIAAQTLTFSGLQRNENAYVYRDLGSDFYYGDFSHQFQFKINAGAAEDSIVFLWGLANAINNFYGLYTESAPALGLYAIVASGTLYLRLYEFYGSAAVHQSGGIAYGLDRYVTITRDETVGTYGKLYCNIYSNAARTTIVDALELSLRAKVDFRYKYSLSSYNTGHALAMSGYVKSFKYPNCNRTLADCRERKNSQHFGGAPGVGRRGLYV